MQGVARGKRRRTTVPQDTAARPLDLLQRQFVAEGPNHLKVKAFTYVAMWCGVVYVAFVIDVFSRCVAGCRASVSMRTDLALDALEQALYDRETDARLAHHSDRAVQPTLLPSSQQYVSTCIARVRSSLLQGTPVQGTSEARVEGEHDGRQIRDAVRGS